MNHIVIIGFMGSGKTRVGKRLAKDMNLPFVDLDKKISDVVKLSTSEFFRKFDEPFYRAEETFMMKEMLSDTERKVISVGAAFPLQEQNEEILHNMGIIIYLKATAPTIIERLLTGQDNILTRGEVSEEKLIDMLESRDPIYQQYADIQVLTGVKSFEDLVKDIETKLLKFDEKKRKSVKVDFGSVKGEEPLPRRDPDEEAPEDRLDLDDYEMPEPKGKPLAKKEVVPEAKPPVKKEAVEEKKPVLDEETPQEPKKPAATRKKAAAKKAEEKAIVEEVMQEEAPAAKEEKPAKEEKLPEKEEVVEKVELPEKEELPEPKKVEAKEPAVKEEKPKKTVKSASKAEENPEEVPKEEAPKEQVLKEEVPKEEVLKEEAPKEETPAKPRRKVARKAPKAVEEPAPDTVPAPAREAPAPKKTVKKAEEEGEEAPKPRTRRTSRKAETVPEEVGPQKVVTQEGNRVILVNKSVAKAPVAPEPADAAPAGEEAPKEPVKKTRARKKKVEDPESPEKTTKKETTASKAKTVTTADGKKLMVVRNHPTSKAKGSEGEGSPE